MTCNLCVYLLWTPNILTDSKSARNRLSKYIKFIVGPKHINHVIVIWRPVFKTLMREKNCVSEGEKLRFRYVTRVWTILFKTYSSKAVLVSLIITYYSCGVFFVHQWFKFLSDHPFIAALRIHVIFFSLTNSKVFIKKNYTKCYNFRI